MINMEFAPDRVDEALQILRSMVERTIWGSSIMGTGSPASASEPRIKGTPEMRPFLSRRLKCF